jgi:non-ribosomal peptide synthetase component F
VEPVTLVDLFERQVGRGPERTALVHEKRALSYGELNGRANRLARRLAELGVGAETVVGVCLHRSPAMVVALLAVLKAGAAYVPLDPGYPRERLAYMLEDSRAEVLVSESELRERLAEIGHSAVWLDVEEEAVGGQAAADPKRPTSSTHPARRGAPKA